MLLHLLVKYFLILKEKFPISTWPCIILYFLPLRLFLSILFLLFLLLILFFLPFHPPLVFSFTFPAPYMSTLSFTSLLLNFSFPSFSLFSCSLSSLSYLSTLLVFSPLPFLPPLPPPSLYFLPPSTSPFHLFPFFFPPSLSSPLLPSPFPLFPFNFSFPIFVLFFLPPDPFLPTPLHPSCSLLYLSCPLYLYASFNYFPLQLFLSIFSPFFPPSLSSSSYLFTPPLFFSHLPFLSPYTSPSSFPNCSIRAFQMFD